MKIAVLLLILLGSINCREESGFLREFFEKFPHLKHPQSEAYYRALDRILRRRKSQSTFEKLIDTKKSTTVSTTTTTKSTTTSSAIKRSITTVPKVSLAKNEDIWFGSTPAPMYRGYVTESYKYRQKPVKQPSLKFHASDPSPPPLKFIEPHRLGHMNHHKTSEKPVVTTVQPLYYSSTKKLKNPYDIIKEELNEPTYMTDPNFSLKDTLKNLKSRKNPYKNSDSMVKPQEIKSLKPQHVDIKPLQSTTTEPYDDLYDYQNYDYDYNYDYVENYLARPDPSDVSSLPPRPPVSQISTETPVTTPIYYTTTTTPPPPPPPTLPPVKKKKKKPSFAQFKHNYYKKPVNTHVTRKPIITAGVTTVKPLVPLTSHFGNFDNFEIQKIQPGVNEFIDLTLKAHKPAEELAFGYFELPHHEVSTEKPYIPVFTTKYPKLYHKANSGHYNPHDHEKPEYNPYGYHVDTTPKPFKTFNIPTQPYYNPQPEEYFYPEPEPHKVKPYVSGVTPTYSTPKPYVPVTYEKPYLPDTYEYKPHKIKPYVSTPKPYVSTPTYVSTTAPYVSDTYDPYFEPGFEFEPYKQPYQEDWPHDHGHPDDWQQAPYVPIKDPYAPVHHHTAHKYKYVSHKHLKYPYGHDYHDPHDFITEPKDTIQKHLLHYNDDPWLPKGPKVKVTPTPPTYQPYKQYDLSSYYNYDGSDDLSFYKHEHAKRKIPIDLGREKGLKTVQNAYEHLDYIDEYEYVPEAPKFPEIFDIQKPKFNQYSTEFTTKKPLKIITSKKPASWNTTKKPIKVFNHSTIGPSLQDLVKPFSTVSTTTTKKPFKLKFKPKGKVISTKRPILKLPTKTPIPSILSTIVPKIPSLGDISEGYQSFIGEIGNSLNGLFGKNGEKKMSPQTSLLNSQQKTDRISSVQPLMSAGGHNELSQLEQIKLLLKENRDKPLL